MKILKSILILMAFMSLGTSFTACSGDNGKSNTEQQGKEYTSTYICPMHCEGSGSEKAGICPECSMDYVLNENHKKESEDHEGHNH